MSLTGATSAFAQDARPRLHVEFVFATGDFDKIPIEQRQAIAAAIGKRLADRAERQWGFLDWTTDPAGDEQAARWEIRLDEEPSETEMGDGTVVTESTIYLRHFAVVGAERRPLWESEANTTIYDLFSLRPLTDAQQLQIDLEEKLDQQINRLLENRPVRDALRAIPLTSELILDENRQRIVVPFRRADLRADLNTRFRVSLKDDTLVDARFDIRESGAVVDAEEHVGFMLGKIVQWDVHTLEVQVPAPWVDELPQLLQDIDGIDVFVTEYSPSLAGELDTSGGLIDDPDI